MNTPILFIIAVTAAFFVTVNSCTNTVTQTKYVDTTIRDTVRVHAWDTLGGTALRFISLFPDSVSGGLISFRTFLDESYVAYSARDAVSSDYIEVPSSSPLTYYAFIQNRVNCFDSIALPTLSPGSITTVAVFDNGDSNGNGSVKPALANDSARLKPPPAGFCYLRFANGVPDSPRPYPRVFVDIDNADTSVFRYLGSDRPYYWGEISPYVLISSGNHEIYLRGDSTGTSVYQKFNAFQSGSYYTAHITGSEYDKNVVFQIDQE
jgi:hypothetical protein